MRKSRMGFRQRVGVQAFCPSMGMSGARDPNSEARQTYTELRGSHISRSRVRSNLLGAKSQHL